MEILLVVVGIIIGGYLVINGRRNSDPLNRKCAAEICEYITSKPEISIEAIREIFLKNARYNAQANHVVSMVPAILIRAGCPKAESMAIVPILRAAAAMIPR